MPITLNTKTYSGAGVANGIANYVNRDAGIAAGFSTLTSSLRIDSMVRGKVILNLPIIAPEATACACPGDVLTSGEVTVSFRLDKKLPAVTRTDLRLRLKDLVASPQFIAMLDNLEPMVGT